MVAAGIGAQVGITLYVISEGRYHPQNFPDATVDFTKLTWDPYQNRSNYEELAVAALQSGNGRGFLTEAASQPDLVSSGGLSLQSGAANPGLYDAYMSQCRLYSPAPPCDAGSFPQGPEDAGVRDSGPEASLDEAGDDGGSADATDAGSPTDAGGASDDGGSAAPDAAPTCPENPSDSCEYFDDLTVALTGLHPENVWVTRLRALLPANALAAGDLHLEPTAAQVSEPNVHHTDAYSDPHYNPCPAASGSSGSSGGNGGCACTTGPELRARFGTYLLIGVSVLGVSALLRRRRR
jgi:MYXO-CTERM domain-containing protein